MIEIKSINTDKGVDFRCKVEGARDDIVEEAASLFISLPKLFADEAPELFGDITDMFRKLVDEEIGYAIIEQNADRRGN